MKTAVRKSYFVRISRSLLETLMCLKTCINYKILNVSGTAMMNSSILGRRHHKLDKSYSP